MPCAWNLTKVSDTKKKRLNISTKSIQLLSSCYCKPRACYQICTKRLLPSGCVRFQRVIYSIVSRLLQSVPSTEMPGRRE